MGKSHSDNGDAFDERKPPDGRSCRGLLYFSSQRKIAGKNPLCFGLARSHDQVHNYPKSEQEVLKDGKALLDFKYACAGYSVHRDNKSMTKTNPELEKHGELPFCMGIEMMAERRSSSQGTTPARQDHLNHRSNHNDEAAPIMPRPPSSIQPPSTPRGFSAEEFTAKFIRSAGLVTAALGKNLARIGNSMKSMADEIFHPDRSRPK